jgi:Sulfotransferase family
MAADGTAADEPQIPAARTAGRLLLDAPVVVLAGARTGSTLLRFILDSHPALACPPETNITRTAQQLMATWAMLSNARDEVPLAGLTAVRGLLDEMFSTYLTARGKRRWCDKSLGTAEVAEKFLVLYPQTRFLCLYRHCMDVIASGIEACPWGLAGYGFDPYVSNSPGNNAAALAHYWADHATASLEFERAHQEICLRVYYEELVSEPEATAEKIFSFLGAEPAPGISAACFAVGHEQAGPGDYKIWSTANVTTGSVGRGVSVPTSVIPAPLRGAVNQLLGELGYTKIDENWNSRGARPDLLADGPVRSATLGGPGRNGNSAPAAAAVPPAGEALQAPDSSVAEVGALVAERVSAALRRMDALSGLADAGGQPTGGQGPFVITVCAADQRADRRDWYIDPARSLLTDLSGSDTDAVWSIIGDTDAWQSVLSGSTNLGVALRRGHLRCTRISADPDAGRDIRVPYIASLLGLSHGVNGQSEH